VSNTIVDMPKLCQMLDNGWRVRLRKNRRGTYTAYGYHPGPAVWQRAKDGFLSLVAEKYREAVADDWGIPGLVVTDDFTPEQSLTRLAYKCVDGVAI
jgi:hypothetical protein